jgi:hypothetical protein
MLPIRTYAADSHGLLAIQVGPAVADCDGHGRTECLARAKVQGAPWVGMARDRLGPAPQPTRLLSVPIYGFNPRLEI